MDAHAAARAWVEGWSRGWWAKDVDPIRAVYTDDARFRSHPFRELQPPADYAAWAFADEDEELAELAFGDPVVHDDRAAIEWWAILRRRDGGEATLAGLSIVRFADDGRVADQRDYWALEEGRRPANFRH